VLTLGLISCNYGLWENSVSGNKPVICLIKSPKESSLLSLKKPLKNYFANVKFAGNFLRVFSTGVLLVSSL